MAEELRSHRPRVVLDTNVVLSALLFPGKTVRRAFEFAFAYCQPVCSEPTWDELALVLQRPEFERYLPLALRLEWLAVLAAQIDMVRVTSQLKVCRDPRDDKFLELAMDAPASTIVSGDQDLLALHPFQSVSILSPADFLGQGA